MAKKKLALFLAGIMLMGSLSVPVWASDDTLNSVDLAAFADPGMNYRPGVLVYVGGGRVERLTKIR